MLTLLLSLVCVAPPELESDSEYERALAEAAESLRAGALDDAMKACRVAVRTSDQTHRGGPRAREALRLCARVALAKDRPKQAATLYRRALDHAPDDRRMRKKLRGAWARALRAARRPTTAVQAVGRADRVVDRLAAAPRRPKRLVSADLRRLREAANELRRHRATRRAAWARALAWRIRALSGDPNGVLRSAKRSKPSPFDAVRALELRAVAEAHWALDEPEAAAVAAVRSALAPGDDMREAGPVTPNRFITKACAKLDAAEGPGVCARRVHRATDAFLVTAHRERPPVRVRENQTLEAIHAEASLLFQDCLLRLARADPERLRDTRLELSWTISREGLAEDLDIRPRRYRDLGDGCLTDRLAWLSYPRLVGGAHQTVAISFELK